MTLRIACSSRVTVTLALSGVGALALSEVEGAQSADMRTRAEITNYEETSTYADVTRIIDGLVATSPLVHTESFGKTEYSLPVGNPEIDRFSDATLFFCNGFQICRKNFRRCCRVNIQIITEGPN